MANRLRNSPATFWRARTKNEKIAIGVGGGMVVAGLLALTILAVQDEPISRRAIEIDPGCTSFTILDEGQLRDDLRRLARDAAARGAIDPLTIASRYVRSVAPMCTTYPANTNLPAEVRLFAMVTKTLLDVMQVEHMLSPTDEATWYEMLVTWAAGQGVAEEDL